MTLKVRNKLLKGLFFVSLFCILSALCFFIIALVNKAITPPPHLRIPGFLNHFAFFKYSFAATMISICLLMMYASASAAQAVRLFENTQSTEVIFFAVFLIGCLCEGVRFLTPLFGLWSTFSDLLFFCGRLVLAGRLLCPLSFVFAAITSTVEQRQDIERNLFVLAAIAIVFSYIAPLNTARISSAGAVTWGFPVLLYIARLLFVAVTFASFWINGYKQNQKEFKNMAFAMLATLAGYGILCSADNYIFMGTGTVLLITGSFFYLRYLHNLYMWK